MEFRTKYNGFGYKHADLDKESLCQSAGYMKVTDVVKQFETAGLHLAASRQAQYDFIAAGERDDISKIPEDYHDPTRSKEYDIFRAHEAYNQTIKRLRAQRAAALAAAKKADEGGKQAEKDAKQSGADVPPVQTPESAKAAEGR